MLWLKGLFVGLPPLSVIFEMTSIGMVVFEPLITSTDTNSELVVERFNVTVCPVPTFGGHPKHRNRPNVDVDDLNTQLSSGIGARNQTFQGNAAYSSRVTCCC